MSNSIAPGSSADVNVRVTALTTNPNVPVTYKTIILKKNLVNGVNTLTQEMMSAANTKYVIKYDYVLGEDITVPAGCVLEFDGGSIDCGVYKIKGNFLPTQLNVLNFGLKNDGITDNTESLRKLLNIVFQDSDTVAKHTLYFPKGIYIVGNNCFGTFDSKWNQCLELIGDMYGVSEIRLKTNGSGDKWLYNVTGGQKLGRFRAEHIHFSTDDIFHGNGFSLHGGNDGHEKHYWFIDCIFSLGTVCETNGNANADLMIFDRCYIRCLTALHSNNGQSVCNRYLNCYLLGSKDMFLIDNGGDIFINQCEIEMHKFVYTAYGTVTVYDNSDTEQYFLFKTLGGGGVGNCLLSVANSRMELHNHSGLCNIKLGYTCLVRGSSIANTPSDGMLLSVINWGAALIMEDSNILRYGIFGVGQSQIENPDFYGYVDLPTLMLVRCNIDRNADSDIVSIKDDAVRVCVKDCYNNTVGLDNSFDNTVCFDYVTNNTGRGQRIPINEKVIMPPYKDNVKSFETDDGNKSFICPLPKYNLVTEIIWDPEVGTDGHSHNITIKGIGYDDSETILDTFTYIPNAPELKRINLFNKNKFKRILVTRDMCYQFGKINFYVKYL